MPVPGGRDSAPVTVGQWLDRWLGQRAGPAGRASGPGRGPSTRRGYASHVRLYLTAHLGQFLLAELSASQVQAMFTAIARQHAAAGQPVTAATLRRVKATLRAALNAAVRAGYLTGNPAVHVQLPPARRPRAAVWTSERIAAWEGTGIRPPVAVWTAAQTAAFLNAIRGHRLYAAYHLIALRGPAPRRGMRAALARRRPGHRHRRDLRAAAGIRRPPHRRPAQDPAQRAGHRPGPHHRRGAARATQPAAGRAAAGRGRISRQRVCLHRPERRPAGARPADPDVQGAGDRARACRRYGCTTCATAPPRSRYRLART